MSTPPMPHLRPHPFATVAHPHTAPQTLAAQAILFGLPAAPPASAKVLELGCGDGTNTIALAFHSPNAQFTGVQFTELSCDNELVPDTGLVAELGLQNIQFMTEDFDSWHPQDQFDYVIAHTTISRLEPAKQSQLLDKIKSALAPNGLAYLSYNCLPGWNSIGAIREFLKFHTLELPDLQAKSVEAIRFLKLVSAFYEEQQSPLRRLFQEELQLLESKQPGAALNDHLAKHNSAFYFHQFVELAESAGFSYSFDADPAMLNVFQFDESEASLLGQVADPIEKEQYKDFIVNRRFRESVLTHKEQKVEPRLNLSVLPGLFLLAEEAVQFSHTIESIADFNESLVVRDTRGVEIGLPDLYAQAMVFLLNKKYKYKSVKVEEFIGEVLAFTGVSEQSNDLVMLLLRHSMSFVMLGLAGLHSTPNDGLDTGANIQFSKLQEMRAAPLNQALAARKQFAVTPLHQVISLDAFHAKLVTLLDGETDMESLVKQIEHDVTSGALRFDDPNVAVDAEARVAKIREALALALATLSNSGLIH